ncbi:MAG: glycosyltransferase [Saprospiraceae bacterium]|nr:glycosyltransferase [Saprospiraceae bacterium]
MSKKIIHILVTPLCWGLGHATRCIPIIQEIEQKGMVPIIASDNEALVLLKKEFPHLICLELPSYNIRYSSENMFWNMAFQTHKLIRAAILEHLAIRKIVKKYQIDAILSDNRYGCYHPACYNIFMSHQLNLKIAPQFFRKKVNHFQQRLLRKFDEIWVPDFAAFPGLAGELSHPSNYFHPKITYLQPISRIKYWETPPKQDILVVISGPEPQRTKFEEKILKIADALKKYKWLIVNGKPNVNFEKKMVGNIQTISHLGSYELNKAILESKFYIGRSGYSSIMDLSKVATKALLIPTPGQTEQEYLAKIIVDNKNYFSCSQQQLNESTIQEILNQID